jgi:hypothetical protein
VVRLALFGYRPLAEHMWTGLRRVTRRAYPRWGLMVSIFASWNKLERWFRDVDALRQVA